MPRPLRGWHSPGHGAGAARGGGHCGQGGRPPSLVWCSPPPHADALQGPPHPCPTHTLDRGHCAQLTAATRSNCETWTSRTPPGKHPGPLAAAPPRRREDTWAPSGHSSRSDGSRHSSLTKEAQTKPQDHQAETLGRSGRHGLLHTAADHLPPRGHVSGHAPTPVKPTSSSNSGWALPTRAPAPSSSRQEGGLSGDGGCPTVSIAARAAGA